MRVWVDVDNAPQVQYLVPLGLAFERAGESVAFTARDNGITLDLMRSRGVPYRAVGERFSRSRTAKVTGLLKRSRALRQAMRPESPALLVSASRPSALAARLMRLPSFIVVDYEYVNLSIYRFLGSHLLFPDVIDPGVFERQGFGKERLIPFSGLKEDISFAGADLANVDPHPLPLVGESAVRVLFRPPAEESHYHRAASSEIASELLAMLARMENVVVIFSPRYDWQIVHVEALSWRKPPVVLREAIPFLRLLGAADLVVSGGGTMLREAAYLGVPAYSLFQGSPGGVDRHLEAIGRLALLSRSDDFGRIRLEKREPWSPLRSNPTTPDEIVRLVLARTG
jgi:uncharacterized protein